MNQQHDDAVLGAFAVLMALGLVVVAAVWFVDEIRRALKRRRDLTDDAMRRGMREAKRLGLLDDDNRKKGSS